MGEKCQGKQPVITLKDVNKTFYIANRANSFRENVFSMFSGSRRHMIKALSDINVEIFEGEFFGIIGSNGSGKSTLLQIMNQTVHPDKGGLVDVRGRSMRLALGMGFNKELTAKQNIQLNASVLGMRIAEINEKMDEIISFAELDKFANNPVKYYSSGMKSKLMFSIAVHAKADIFLMDEFFGGVGDKNFKIKADKVFYERLIKGKTIIHVNHNIEIIRKYCTRVMVLEKGRIVKIGTPDEVLD